MYDTFPAAAVAAKSLIPKKKELVVQDYSSAPLRTLWTISAPTRGPFLIIDGFVIKAIETVHATWLNRRKWADRIGTMIFYSLYEYWKIGIPIAVGVDWLLTTGPGRR